MTTPTQEPTQSPTQDSACQEVFSQAPVNAQNTYNPNRLLDTIIAKMLLKNDAALSRFLEIAPPLISKIRHHRAPISATVLIVMHEKTGLTIRELRDLMGDRRTKYRLSDAQGRPHA